MIFECDQCKKKYKYDEAKLGDKSSVKAKCPNCGNIIEIKNPLSPSSPTQIAREKFTPKEEESSDRTLSSGSVANYGLFKLPEDRKLSLAVIQGEQVGQVITINKPRMVMGRSDADIIVKDLEASRQHAAIEVMGDRVLLRDLGSTNGTYVEEKAISTTYLDDRSEFRIGTTVFMLIVTDA